MSSLIVLPSDALRDDASTSRSIVQILSRQQPWALGALDPRHPLVANDDDVFTVLSARWNAQFASDALATGKFVHGPDGRIQVAIADKIEKVAGYVFEALTIRLANDRSREIGRHLFKWATGRKRLVARAYEPFQAIGVGHISAPPSLQNPQMRQFDVIFARMNQSLREFEPALYMNSTVAAGIQIKAIRGNETEQIIQPVLIGQYRRVLTFLRHVDGRHSADVVDYEVRRLRAQGEISEAEADRVREAVGRPEQFGIEQQAVDEYYDYIRRWHRNEAAADATVFRAAGFAAQLQLRGSSSMIGLHTSISEADEVQEIEKTVRAMA